MKRTLYVGIDVACSQAKALPVIIAEDKGGGSLTPLAGRTMANFPQWPKGVGNVAIVAAGPGFQARLHPAWVLAVQVRDMLLTAEKVVRGNIVAVGIDAPRHPATTNPANGKAQLRSREAAMAAKGISFIQTPSNFAGICAKAAAHRGASEHPAAQEPVVDGPRFRAVQCAVGEVGFQLRVGNLSLRRLCREGREREKRGSI